MTVFKDSKNKEIDVMYANTEDNLSVNWGVKNWGFGGFHFHYDSEQDRLIFDTEYMGKEFVKAVLCKMVDNGLFTDFEKSEKKVNQLSVQEINEMNLFGSGIQLSFPYYVNYAKDNEKVLELRWRYRNENNKKYIINICLEIDKVVELIEKKAIAEIGIEQYNADLTMIEKVELFSYAEIVKVIGFNEGFISAEQWEWETKDKK